MGNFLKFLKLLVNHNEALKRVILQNAPENLKLTSPKIQEGIVSAVALETTQAIIFKLRDAPFALLVDLSHDISVKEQMTIVLCYIDHRGSVIECFLAIANVTNTIVQDIVNAMELVRTSKE